MILTCPQCATQNRVPARRMGQRARCGGCKAALSPPDQPLAIRTEQDFEEVTRDSPFPVVVDFWAAWCGPCRVAEPELKKLAKDRASRVVVAKVDTEALPSVAARHRIESLPTFVRFDQGREVGRVGGAMPARALAERLGLDEGSAPRPNG